MSLYAELNAAERELAEARKKVAELEAEIQAIQAAMRAEADEARETDMMREAVEALKDD